MKERLKQIRKNDSHGKTQDSFAEFLGISKQNVSSYELGRRTPTDAVIQLICQKCKVNESWLRTGQGEPYIHRSKDEEIAEMLMDIQLDGEDTFKHRLISALARLDENGWKTIEKFVDDIIDKNKAGD